MKQCSKCKQTKLEIQFSKNKSNKDGLFHYCNVIALERKVIESKIQMLVNKREEKGQTK
jgi:seryl-tRNA synthetase